MVLVDKEVWCGGVADKAYHNMVGIVAPPLPHHKPPARKFCNIRLLSLCFARKGRHVVSLYLYSLEAIYFAVVWLCSYNNGDNDEDDDDGSCASCLLMMMTMRTYSRFVDHHLFA